RRIFRRQRKSKCEISRKTKKAKSRRPPNDSTMKNILSVIVLCSIAATTFAAQSLIEMNYRALVSRGDLDYTNPATRSEEGMPVGNGRMGSLVWTTPSALHFQINRVDVFGENSYTVSFPQADSDYAAGCG